MGVGLSKILTLACDADSAVEMVSWNVNKAIQCFVQYGGFGPSSTFLQWN